MFILHTDGGSRSNPGLAGVGWVLHFRDTIYAYAMGTIGHATNNEAEYRALLCGLDYFLSLHQDELLKIRTDSQLVIRQITGEYESQGVLSDLYEEAVGKLARINVQIEWCPRLSNQSADQLVNMALDRRLPYTVVPVYGQGLARFDPLAIQLRSKHYASYPKDYRAGN